jgi:hypothetical protein
MSCDDTVWLADGGPGIVVGIGHGKVAILWPTGSVSRHKFSDVVHYQPFTKESSC